MSKANKTIALTPQTYEDLKAFREALSKVRGKQTTYDETVFFLIDAFYTLTECIEEKDKVLKEFSRLNDLIDGKLRSVNLEPKGNLERLVYALNYLYPIDKSQKEEVEKIAAKTQGSIAATLLGIINIGLTHYGRLTFLLTEKDAVRYSNFLSKLPKEEKEKVEKELTQTLETVFRKKLSMLEKKYSGRKK